MPSGEIKQYTQLKDFTRGIYSASMRSLSSTAFVPAPLGAAQQTNTYRCIGIPTGGLAPLPGNTAIYGVPAGNQDSASVYYPSMLAVMGPLGTPPTPGVIAGTGNPDELIFGLNYVSSFFAGVKQNTNVYSLAMNQTLNTGLQFPPTNQIYGASVGTANIINGQSHAITRVHPTDYTLPGNPTLYFDDNNAGGLGVSSSLLAYPNPNTPTLYTNFNYTPFTGQVFGHQGRVVTLLSQYFTHPGTNLKNNEQMNFNDPPNSFTDPTTGKNQVFVPESPFGYGAWGSISIGELFMVKHHGGAVYVTGDIANPTITRLPAVPSTGGLLSLSASTPIGFMYPTQSSGVYLWNGGNTSQKISQQLDDSFYVYPQAILNTGVIVQLEQWQEWVLCTNNWLYDTVTRSWWRLDDPTQSFTSTSPINYGVPKLVYRYFARSFFDNIMYCVVDNYQNVTSGSYAIWQYDRGVPASSYSWQSHPIPVTTELMVDVREIVVLAQGNGQVSITLTDAEGNPQSDGPNVFIINSPNQPQRLRQRTQIHGYNIMVRVQSQSQPGAQPVAPNNPLPAPVVYEVNLGWLESTMTASV